MKKNEKLIVSQPVEEGVTSKEETGKKKKFVESTEFAASVASGAAAAAGLWQMMDGETVAIPQPVSDEEEELAMQLPVSENLEEETVAVAPAAVQQPAGKVAKKTAESDEEQTAEQDEEPLAASLAEEQAEVAMATAAPAEPEEVESSVDLQVEFTESQSQPEMAAVEPIEDPQPQPELAEVETTVEPEPVAEQVLPVAEPVLAENIESEPALVDIQSGDVIEVDDLLAMAEVDPNDFDSKSVLDFDKVGTMIGEDGQVMATATYHYEDGQQLMLVDTDGDQMFDHIASAEGKLYFEADYHLSVGDVATMVEGNDGYLASTDVDTSDLDFGADMILS